MARTFAPSLSRLKTAWERILSHPQYQNHRHLRQFGSRGARGHGWYVNYRAGKGGRHLQGRYFDRDSLEECQEWNDSVLKLGTTRVFMDVVLEPKKQIEEAGAEDDEEGRPKSRPGVEVMPDASTLVGDKHRLLMDLASAVMPESTDNFIKLCQLEEHGYKASKFFRWEREVGLCGGDVLTNMGRSGLPAPHDYEQIQRELHLTNDLDDVETLLDTVEPLLARTIFRDPLCLWHLPGTVTMLVKRVNDIDSRFLLCTKRAMHMDGVHRAIGQLTPESLSTVQGWQEQMLTWGGGIPTTHDIFVVDCGVVNDAGDGDKKEETVAAA